MNPILNNIFDNSMAVLSYFTVDPQAPYTFLCVDYSSYMR